MNAELTGTQVFAVSEARNAVVRPTSAFSRKHLGNFGVIAERALTSAVAVPHRMEANAKADIPTVVIISI